MTNSRNPQLPDMAATVDRLNKLLNVIPDEDVEPEEWAAAMADPQLVEPALSAYDRPDAVDDERTLLVELLFNTFEFCAIELEGNPEWRRILDRIERDFHLHEPALQRWAEPDDGNPWMIGAALKTILARHNSGK